MKLKKNTVLYASTVLACGNIALQLLGFVYRVILSRYAGAEGLGVYRLVNSAYMILHAGCISGVTLACSRMSAAFHAKREPQKVSAVLRLAFSVFFVCVSFCVLLFWWQGDHIAVGFLNDARTAKAFPFVLICLALTGVENIFKSLFIGLDHMQYTSYSEVGEQLVRIVAVWLLLSCYKGQDYGTIAMLIFLGMVISEVFSAVFLHCIFRKEKRVSGRARGKIDGGIARQFFTIAIPVCTTAVISNVLGSMGNVMLPKRLMLSGMTYDGALASLGVVSGMALPLLLMPIALVSSICTALLPPVAAAHATGNQKRLRKLIERALFTVGLLTIPATAFMLPLSPALSALFFRESIPMAHFAWLGIVAVMTYYHMVTANLMNGVGLQQYTLVSVISGELLQLLLIYNLASRPDMGINGYLYALVISDVYVTLFNLFVLYRHTRFRMRPLRRFGMPLLCGATTFAWTRIFLTLFNRHCASVALALGLAALGAVVLYLFLLRLFDVHVFTYLRTRIVSSDPPDKAELLHLP